MPLPFDVDATWLNLTASYDGGELRRADAAFLAGAGGAAYGGVARHGDSDLIVTVDGADVVTVQPGSVVIPGGDAAVGVGVYRAALAAAITGTLTARNATNPRIDLLVFRAMDTSVVGAHAAYTGRVELLAGTPSATPGVPAKPSMAVELARITVPATGGGAATVDSTFRTYATAAGAELVVPTAARLPATGVAKWQMARVLDTGLQYRWTGTAWTPVRQVGSNVVTTNASGEATVAFPAPFAAAPIVVPAVVDAAIVVTWIVSVTASGFTFRTYLANTGAVYAGLLRINYIASAV